LWKAAEGSLRRAAFVSLSLFLHPMKSRFTAILCLAGVICPAFCFISCSAQKGPAAATTAVVQGTGSKTRPAAGALHSKEARTASVAKKPGPPRTYECLFEDRLIHVRAAVDRSGKKLPQEVLPDGSGVPVGLAWEEAPAGMDYHEEVLGSWQGRQILLSSYHGVTSYPEGGTEEWTHCLVSCEDSEKILRPFLVIQKDAVGIIDLKCELKPSSTRPTELSANWRYSGSGLMWDSAEFRFGPGGPHLVKLQGGGRQMKTITRTYNSTGRLVKTHTESDPW
jgi:hypothetical protein